LLRFAVIGGRALAALERDAVTPLESDPEWRDASQSRQQRDAARAVAERAARSLGLGLAMVDVTETRQGPMIVDVTANLAFAQIERLTGAALAEALMIHIEQECRTRRPLAAGN
jgi:ribosomal protein S6--L-glutamate ligase